MVKLKHCKTLKYWNTINYNSPEMFLVIAYNFRFSSNHWSVRLHTWYKRNILFRYYRLFPFRYEIKLQTFNNHSWNDSRAFYEINKKLYCWF